MHLQYFFKSCIKVFLYIQVLFISVLADILANPQDKKQRMFDKFGYDSESISDAPVLPKNASKAELKPSTNGQLSVNSNNQQAKTKDEKKGEVQNMRERERVSHNEGKHFLLSKILVKNEKRMRQKITN